MIKILTGWSAPGGSTESFIRLTNEFNSRGFDATLYGPHDWHLDKCKSSMLVNEMSIAKDDVVMVHFLDINKRLPAKKFIYVCHEKQIKPVTERHHHYDACVFLHDNHREFHSTYQGPSFIIPNLFDNISIKKRRNYEKYAGVIGSIDANKRTHISIQRAKDKGYERINVYGTINDDGYYDEHVKPLIDNKQVFYKGFCSREEIYSSIHAAFLSSVSECAPFVLQECNQTNTCFYGDDHIMYDISNNTNDDIIKMWVDLIS